MARDGDVCNLRIAKQYILKNVRFLSLVALLVLFFCYNALYLFVSPTLDSIKLYENLEIETVDYLQSCQLPLLHPFEPEVMSYFKAPPPIRCRSKIPMLTFIDDHGFLRYNSSAFIESGYYLDSLTCSYQEIWRGDSDSEVVYGPSKPMTGMDKPESDFTYVSCWRLSWLPSVYTMFHAYAQRDPLVRKSKDDEEVGIAVVGIDSVSRLNFMRQLPRSFMTLTQKLNAVVFKGFNKVGHNTLPNIVPILTGSPPKETTASGTFDDWPFLWKELRKDNVATLYGEDQTYISTFSWWGAGFSKDPTNHYFHRYWLAVDGSHLNGISSAMCLGSIPKHRIYLNYIQSFLRTYKDSPFFMFSLENEPCHDYMNTLGVMDRDLENFLLTSYSEGLLNRTILFVLADHGQRVDPFRKTPQGRLEDFMPMVSIVVPPWLAKKYPQLMENLQINSKRLTSSYDLYCTFQDIFLRKSTQTKKSATYDFAKPKFGRSFFENIALDRTCEDAGIPEMYCICKEDMEVLPDNHPLVMSSMEILLNYTNHQVLNGESELWQTTFLDFKKNLKVWNKTLTPEDDPVTNLQQCARLSLQKVEEAKLVVKAGERRLVHIKYRTDPNDGLYEARVEWTPDHQGKVHEEIIRTNRYGNQPNCLSRALLIMVPYVRSACYCT